MKDRMKIVRRNNTNNTETEKYLVDEHNQVTDLEKEGEEEDADRSNEQD